MAEENKIPHRHLHQGYKNLCLGCKSHIKLRGRSAFHRKSWTLVAQPYPRGVCSVLAKALLISSGLSSGSQSFDPASCARCTNARIGEAANPGPVADREGLLEDVPLVEAKTAALQSKVWKKFESWLRARLSPGAFDATLASPLLLCRLLKEYGNVLYSEGAALYIYRHLCVFVQKICHWCQAFHEHCLGQFASVGVIRAGGSSRADPW